MPFADVVLAPSGTMATALKLVPVRWSEIRVAIGSVDRTWRREVMSLLADADVQVIAGVTSPEDAWSKLSVDPVDLLVLPSEPRAATIDLVRRLRTPGVTPCPHVQIVVMTYPLTPEEVIAWVKLGVDYLCGWPTDPRRLVLRLQRIIAHPARKTQVATYIGPDRRRSPRAVYSGSERRQAEPAP